ncbi:pseudouridine synthase [Alteromonas gilva]|uniref:tRNA pseudouridine synthase C n=1 Tax=Alteromonas gilva TaxID=2987522 RepID=A0ABT5L1P3_9ALTE|nr:pseudouridine synthase [Alteromonas gilva]MDC8830396.1 pseudouridine synthase [Alteromonas gilva]
MTNETLPIIYQDEYLVAIYKPAGLLVHRSPIDKHETRFAVQILRDQLGQHVFPLHRLDRPTAGLLLFALDSETAAKMNQQMMANGMHKSYRTLVRGYVKAPGMIDYALKYRWDKYADADRTRDVAPQTAHSDYWPLAHYELPFAVGRYTSARYSWLGMRPHTGRKHQLRRHIQHLRHPIVGDTTHGDGKHNALMRQQFHNHRLMLVCVSMGFYHPVSDEWLTISTQVDSEIAELLVSWQPFLTWSQK